MEPTNWPKVNTAFLLIHGTAPHRPYQTIDGFVRGFHEMLEETNPEVRDELKKTNLEVRHELKRPEEQIQSDFRLKRSDDWIRSYVRFKLSGKPSYIDFYEYYWDRYVVRHITLDELGDWLKNVNKGKKALEKELKSEKDEERRKRLNVNKGKKAFEKELKSGKDEERRKRLEEFIKHKTPFLKVATGCFGWVLRRIICALNYLPLDEIRDVCIRIITRYLLPNWEDTVIYSLSDRRSSYYEIREKILSGAVSQLRELMNSDSDYEQIIVVGHSLGTVIAHDALNRIALDASTTPKPQKDKLGNIKGLVTFGTFLDIVRLLEERTPKENSVQRVILKQRHGFREHDLPFDQPAKDQEVRPTNEPVNYDPLNNVKWLNFYRPDDFISNCELIAYEFNPEVGDAQVKCDKPIEAGCCISLLYKIPIVNWFTKSMAAHGSYWEDDKMYGKIADTFF